MPNLAPCTSYATHIAPSSGVLIPRFATGLDPHSTERWEVGIASLVLGAGLVGLALAPDRRRKVKPAVSEATV